MCSILNRNCNISIIFGDVRSSSSDVALVFSKSKMFEIRDGGDRNYDIVQLRSNGHDEK